MVWIEVVATATIMSAMSIAAHSGVRSPSARPAPHANSTMATKIAVACGNGTCIFDHGLLKRAELGFYGQLGPAGNAEKDADQDAGRRHWNPLPGAEHGHGALDQGRHVS